MIRNSRALLLAALIVFAVAGCGKDSGTAPGAATGYRADAAGLKSLFGDIQKAIKGGDQKTAAALTRSLLPDKARVMRALKDDAGEIADKIVAMHQRFAPESEKDAASMLATDGERTEILVHASTTEELIAYENGSPAYMEFPGGARKAAETFLRPGITFYEVELVRPGEERGMKYHLFFHDGKQWTMLGPVWRALR